MALTSTGWCELLLLLRRGLCCSGCGSRAHWGQHGTPACSHAALRLRCSTATQGPRASDHGEVTQCCSKAAKEGAIAERGEARCKGGERLSVPRAQQLLKPHPTPGIQWCYIHTHWVGTTSNRPTLLGTGQWAQMAGPSCTATHILEESDPLASGRETPPQGCLGYARRCFPAAWRWAFFPAGCLHKSQDRKGKGWEGAQATLWRSVGD